MAMIGGLSRPSGGTVTVDGTDIWRLSETALAAFRNGRSASCSSSRACCRRCGDRQRGAAGAAWRGDRRGRSLRERAARLLVGLGLADYLDAYPSEVSAGEQRRAVIARALINAPALLLADEPTSDLDEQTELEIMAQLLRTNREDGVTLVLVTHALALAAEADQVVQIADGTIVP